MNDIIKVIVTRNSVRTYSYTLRHYGVVVYNSISYKQSHSVLKNLRALQREFSKKETDNIIQMPNRLVIRTKNNVTIFHSEQVIQADLLEHDMRRFFRNNPTYINSKGSIKQL